MRILHTADWHLGHRLYNRDRTEEHRAALDWLIRVIEQECVDVVIVAGDIFDVTNPSNQAKGLYYQFLGRLVNTCCKSAVVVGGNHDSASLLDAPRELLKALQLHVVGAADGDPADRILSIDCGEEQLLVAAVPYLRERDLRKARFDESSSDRALALREGIRDHFLQIGAAAEAARAGAAHVPIVATGHLFVSGATDDEEKKSYIYQADEHNIGAEQFPTCFDYVALGHIHRAQRIADHDHIRYAGSLVPLTFVEGQAARSVRLVEVGPAGQPVRSHKLPVPGGRRLLRLRYPLEEVERRLCEAVRQPLAEGELTPWAEVRVLTDEPVPNLRDRLLKVIREALPDPKAPLPLELVRISRERLTPRAVGGLRERDTVRQLDELDPSEVFGQLCARHEHPEQLAKQLKQDFLELRNWINEGAA